MKEASRKLEGVLNGRSPVRWTIPSPPQVGSSLLCSMGSAPRACTFLLVVSSLSLLAGCATVKPVDRGALADPIMSFEEDARDERRELHWLEAREGSTGGAEGAGGGCACN